MYLDKMPNLYLPQDRISDLAEDILLHGLIWEKINYICLNHPKDLNLSICSNGEV